MVWSNFAIGIFLFSLSSYGLSLPYQNALTCDQAIENANKKAKILGKLQGKLVQLNIDLANAVLDCAGGNPEACQDANEIPIQIQSLMPLIAQAESAHQIALQTAIFICGDEVAQTIRTKQNKISC